MKTFIALTSVIALALASMMGIAFLALRATLAPTPGEWTIPLKLGPLTLQAGVPSMTRLATSAWVGPVLDGRRMPSRFGMLHFTFGADRALHVRCAPCVLQTAGLGESPLKLESVDISMRRIGDAVSGEFRAGKVHGNWQGRLTPSQIRVRLAVPPTPISEGDALFARDIPELASARIAGEFSLTANLLLPEGNWSFKPHLTQFSVGGLGTEAWVGARSACGRPSRLMPESWLARGVIAAEDQRFYEHTGYDLAEIVQSLARNLAEQRTARGGSTLSQQAARLMVTGAERSPVRKLRELLYAVEMESTLGKARILKLYLDNAPWGDGLCGAEAAARFYFGARAHELTQMQAAWLAAMLHNPAREAQHWAERGTIDIARAQWVLLGMRGMPRARKLELAQEMDLADWKPWWSPPATPPLLQR